jgi:hypothetical protein
LQYDSSAIAQKRSATLTDLYYNYANERLLQHAHNNLFADVLHTYAQEQIEVDLAEPRTSATAMVELLDKQSQQELVSS